MRGWRLNQNFKYVQKPITYIGKERNIAKKDTSEKMRIALCFPEVYTLGMSNLGYKILYHLFNREQDVYAERCFSPQSDMERILVETQQPLFTLETRTPLRKFDIFAVSLDYELNITNMLNALSISHIPILSSQRTEDDPIVIVGGTIAYNPLPIQRFVDIFAIGDGECLVKDIIDIMREKKKKKLNKKEVLEAFNEREGFYVPAVSEGKIVNRQITDKLTRDDFPINQIVPYTEIIHNRYVIEVSRGCTRGCRFCQSGYIYRPTRQRSLEDILYIVNKGIKNTGWEEVSLLSFSAGDHSEFHEMVYALRKMLPDVGISLPSLRADVFTEDVAKFLSSGSSGVTIAAEAGTDRLRRIINKDIKEDDIFRTAEVARKYGWRHIKVYFMIGLPGENEDDIQGIVEISKKLTGIIKDNVTIKISPFVPRPHTPFQWERQYLLEEIREKEDFLSRELKGIKKIKFKVRSPYISMVEGLIARGDERVGDIIQYVFKNGAKLEGWQEFFNFKRYQSALNKMGYNWEEFLGERDADEKLPWDIVDIGIERGFLAKERKRAKKGEILKDCRLTSCTFCGMCPGNIAGELKKRKQISFTPISIEKKEQGIKRFRIYFSKMGEMKFLSHLDIMRLFLTSGRIAGIKFAYKGKYRRRPKISFGPALSVGIEGENEIFDVYTYKMVAKEVWNDALPDGIFIKKTKEIPLNYPNITRGDIVLVYEFLTASNFGKKREKNSFDEKKLLDIGKSVLYIKREKKIIEVGILGKRVSLIHKISDELNIKDYKRKGIYKMRNGSMEEI